MWKLQKITVFWVRSFQFLFHNQKKKVKFEVNLANLNSHQYLLLNDENKDRSSLCKDLKDEILGPLDHEKLNNEGKNC